ncbi:GGDEF domain-containing protein [Rhodanobacter sp. Si-c]|uniref:diguanylate cyclase n=1 Tax=Rhodanobacter lycopersici TaxID=3162487 RepID=A0ABV3Q9J1_9GAMM
MPRLRAPFSSFLLLYVLCHALALWIDRGAAKPLSYAFLSATPLLAGVACFLRSRRRDAAAGNWLALALAMLLWAGGMFAGMWQDVIQQNSNVAPGLSMLLYVLYGVPLTFILASPGKDAWWLRLIDGVLAAVLGYLFFVQTFSFATMHGADAQGVVNLRLMFDIENIYIAAFALIRLAATGGGESRMFFKALSWYACVYLAVAAFNNHFDADVDFGTPVDLLIDLPFLLLFGLACSWHKAARPAVVPARLVWAVRAGSPLLLPASLLAVSAAILHGEPRHAVAGFAIAALGYGLRSILAQVGAFEERAQLNELALHDPLTGLANRRQFEASLRRAWQRVRRRDDGLALLLIDVDHFKQVNDSLGHQAGDRCLRAVAGALSACLNRGGDSLARYGGEEFVAILPVATPESARMMGEAMRAAVAALRMPAPEAETRLTVSIGVGFVQQAGDQDASLLAVADAALYRAKHAGRNRVELGML